MAGLIEKDFLKSLFNRQVTAPTKFGSTYFMPIGDGANIFGGNTYLKDFQEVPELNAIINIRARSIASWRLSLVSDTTGKEIMNQEQLAKILRRPNYFQSQIELFRQSELFRCIYGNEYLYFLKPVGMKNSYAGLFTLDPSKVTIKYTSKNLPFLESTNDYIEYWYDTGNGSKIKLEKDNIIHLNDNRAGFNNADSSSFLKGTSKIQSLQAPIQNIREAYKKRNIILKMPIGIFSGNSTDATSYAIPMNEDEKEKAQSALRSHGALPIFTNLGVVYNDMSINANNMGLFEKVREDTAKLCDAFGIPYEVLASQKGVTFANLKEAKKQMYEESIIPDGNEKVEALNDKVESDKKAWHINADYTYLPVFAEDKKQSAISLNQMVTGLSKALTDGAITIQQYQEQLKKFGI